MEDRNISDSQLNASTIHPIHPARHARLHNAQFWATTSLNINQWLQVDFEEEQTVTKVATQGRSLERGSYFQWVTTYSLDYSLDGTSFQFYKQFGDVKVSFFNRFFFMDSVYLYAKSGAPNGEKISARKASTTKEIPGLEMTAGQRTMSGQK